MRGKIKKKNFDLARVASHAGQGFNWDLYLRALKLLFCGYLYSKFIKNGVKTKLSR